MVGKVVKLLSTVEPVTPIEIGFEPLVPCDNLPNDKYHKILFIVEGSNTDHITKDISKVFKIEYEVAENIKKSFKNSC